MRILYLMMTFVFFLGCTQVSKLPFSSPKKKADDLAQASGFQKFYIPTQYFTLTSYIRWQNHQDPLIVYIEGDGLAWVHKSQRSADPTPTEPLVLTLATLDPRPNVLYLARPCQYAREEELADPSRCHSDYWTSKRYSEEVLQSLEEALGFFRKADQWVSFIGYSGGGNLATLLASRLSQVAELRTVAGNLDHVSLHHYHHVTQLQNSLSALQVAKRLVPLPQHHYLGNKDEVIPGFLVENFKKEAGNPLCLKITVLEGITHHYGWEKVWPELISHPITCQK